MRKTSVTDTSIDAYYGLDLTRQQRTVLRAIEILHEACIADIATHLGWQRSTVSGRLNDLKHAALVVPAGKRRSRTTGVTSEHWRVKDINGGLF